MMKYQEPTTYALLDLSSEELTFIIQGLNEMREVYARFAKTSEAAQEDAAILNDLIAAIERRYSGDGD